MIRAVLEDQGPVPLVEFFLSPRFWCSRPTFNLTPESITHLVLFEKNTPLEVENPRTEIPDASNHITSQQLSRAFWNCTSRRIVKVSGYGDLVT